MNIVLATALVASALNSVTWLQNVRTDSFTVMCEAKSCCDRLQLEYWPTTTGERKSKRFTYWPTAGGTWIAKARVNIDGHAGETIRYEITSRGKALTDEGSSGDVRLWGAPDDGEFTAVVWGDNQSGIAARDWSVDKCATIRGAFSHMMTRNPDFGLSTGDMAGSGIYESELRPLLLEVTNPILGHFIPYYVAWGNHDDKFPGRYFDTRRFFSTGAEDDKRYRFAIADNYYLYRGDVLFIFIDNLSYDFGRQTLRGWLKRLLKSKQAQDAKFRIVLQHSPVYLEVWADDHVCQQCRDIFNDYRVDLVLSGHMHGCERIACEGDTFIQLTNGGLGYLDHDENVEANYGDATFIGGHKDIPYLWARESEPGVLGPAEPVHTSCISSYTELSATGDKLTITYHGFNADGSYIGAFDKFTLTARPRGSFAAPDISYPDVDYDGSTPAPDPEGEWGMRFVPVGTSGAKIATAPITCEQWAEFQPTVSQSPRTSEFQTGMSRREAEAFIAWINNGTDTYRLPTEDEMRELLFFDGAWHDTCEAGEITEWTSTEDPETGWCRIMGGNKWASPTTWTSRFDKPAIATPCCFADYLGFRLVKNGRR